jgi:hypothetical protein
MSETPSKPRIAGRDTVKIVLNHKGVKNLMASEDMHTLLEAKSKRVGTILKKTFGRVEVRRTNGKDGRAAIHYVVTKMPKADFKNSTLQKALMDAKMRPGKK